MARSTTSSSAVGILRGMLVAATLLACGSGSPAVSSVPSAAPEATAAASAASSDEPGSAGSGLCGVFTREELAPFLGADPGPGSGGGPLDSTCQWGAGDADVMIQKVPTEYFEDPRAADGYRELDGIGDAAYVAPHAFGRITAARTPDAAYLVIASDDTDEAAQVGLLSRFIERSPGAAELPAAEPPEATDPSVAPGAGPAIDCPVRTEEVSDATGIAMVQGQGCSWAAVDTGTLFEVLLSDMPMPLFEHVQAGQPVAGLGDEAYTDQTGALYVRVGGRAMSIHLVTLSLDEQEASDLAVAIARIAVERLR